MTFGVEKRHRRSAAEIVAGLDPSEAAVYLSQRIRVLQITEQELYELCPPQVRGLLEQLLSR